MRLRRLALTDVGGVGSAELTVAERGVSVVLAPNETGKSTLLRAYRLLLSRTGHTGRTNEVRALQPVGRDVGSTIAAELVIGGETFDVERTYNRRAASSVTVRGTSTVSRTGKEADELLRSRFLAAVDQDLHELLMFEQGRALEALAGAASTTVVGALRARDADAAPDAGDGLLEALRARVGRAFHSRNGTLIGPLRKQQQEVEDAEEQRDELAGRIAALGEDGPDESATIARLTEELAAVTARIEGAAAAARAVTARRLRDATADRLQQRTAQVGGVERLAAEEAELAARLAATVEGLAGLAERVTALEREAADASERRGTLLATAARAEARLVAALERAVEATTAALAEERVDAGLVARARGLVREVELAGARLEGGAWELTATAGRPLTLEVDGEQVGLAAGEDLTRAVSASLVLSDPDGTVIGLRADAGRQETVAGLARAGAELAELLTDVGAVDLEALERRLAAREELAARRAELERTLADLREDPVVAEPQHADGAAGGADGPSEDPAEPDLDALTAAHTAALDALGAAGDDGGGALAEATALRTQREQAAEQQREELARAAERRREADSALADARTQRSDEALAEEAAQAAEALEALGDVGEQEDVAALEAERDRIEAAREEVRRRADVAEGRRASVGALQMVLDTLADNAEALRTLLDRDVREAEAARSLLERLEAARAEQGDRYREPLEARIRELLTVLYGFDCRVELDDDLRIVQRADADGRMIPWAQLSGGAREQAAVVTGLAIAELAGDGGVPFWIDDAIVFTDDDRVSTLKGLLAATSAQVIVLTCRSELADGLPAAGLTLGPSPT